MRNSIKHHLNTQSLSPNRIQQPRRKLALAASIAASISAPTNLHAEEPVRKKGTAALIEEVVVTARKRAEGSQDVPLSVSAFGADQMEALKIRDLGNLAVGMPNVALDDAGTARGYANFSIRGLGINSSILSIDPTVGVFVDGVYMGTPSGMVFDVFDLERIEVLRGPQGTLFGRNVTGGAVLMNTKKPGDEFEASVKTAVDGGGDGGLNKYVMGTVSGPLSDTFAAKFTGYYNEDDGWFENKFTGEDFGAAEQTMFRTVGVWKPTAGTEVIARWEHAINDSDGPAGQNHINGSGVGGVVATFDRDSHDFSIDEEGFYTTETDFVTLELNQDVAFGNGTITNIFGWRAYGADSFGDIDSQPAFLFHSKSWT
ncbi:TonB-dependent receptor, partial [Ketobacter sp.]